MNDSGGFSFPPIYLPWSPSSLSPEQVQHLTSLVYTMGLDRVLELGGGVSTMCLYWTLAHMPNFGPEQLQGELTTIEYSYLWRSLLVKGCAMVDGCTPGNEVRHTYFDNVEAYIDAKPKKPPQLILVDGPYAGSDPNARRVAVGLVRFCHHGGLTIFMDDTDRFGEQCILQELLDFADHRILTKKENYTVFIYQ